MTTRSTRRLGDRGNGTPADQNEPEGGVKSTQVSIEDILVIISRHLEGRKSSNCLHNQPMNLKVIFSDFS